MFGVLIFEYVYVLFLFVENGDKFSKRYGVMLFVSFCNVGVSVDLIVGLLVYLVGLVLDVWLRIVKEIVEYFVW